MRRKKYIFILVLLCTQPAWAIFCDDPIELPVTATEINECTPGSTPPDPPDPPDPGPDPVPGGTIAFTQVPVPDNPNGGPSGSNKGWFGVYVWREDGQGFAAMHDHTDGGSGGNDPVWRWDAGAWVYDGQLPDTTQIRHSNTIRRPDGVYPVSGGQGFGSGRNDSIHVGGESFWLCTVKKWWSGACQGWGDFNSDNIDDVLRSDGVLLDGATLMPLPQSVDGQVPATVLAVGIDLFSSANYTKPVCIWTDRVLTGEGLFDATGAKLASLPTTEQVKGGFACGSLSGDADPEWVYYSAGGNDVNPSGTAHLLRIDGDTLTPLTIDGLPTAGGHWRRYNLPTVADFNNDGVDDLLLPDHGGVYQGAADYTFTQVHSFPQSDKGPAASAADWDNDGKIDFCATSLTTEFAPNCYINVTEPPQ